MSVLIKGMKMPKSCLDCPCNLNLFFCKVCGGREITDQTSITTKNDVITVSRPDWCPLMEIRDE